MTIDPQRAQALFLAASELSDSAARREMLDRECGRDAGLRQRVEALLSAHDATGGFDAEPSEPAVGATLEEPIVDRAGAVIAGRYKLRQPIGEGGMGTVWMADQTEPIKRKVAVKLIRVERGQSKAILARFEAERQAIALMDHPHIAKLLDAGSTETGSPFFVMELVKGIPLNDYCDQHQLTVPERLHLFTQICSAVQHAHQKGIIHRDLKPSNILVESHDGKPVPKVIDFGLAKATTSLQLTEQSMFTAFGSVMGTPLYMAPEQANFNALDVDTRADVYALGVVLYELLTGTTPITRDTLKKAALDEMLRLIREQEAPTPSSRLSSTENSPCVAANRQLEPAKLGRFVKGELDWIVMKALAKDRDRRYETANGFAKDIERFLNQEPVTAGPPSARYRLQKFVQRHRGQVIAASLVLLALVAGVVGTTLGLLEAMRQTEFARKETEAKEEARAAEAEQRAAAESNEAKAVAAKENESRQRQIAEAEKKKAIAFRDKALDALRATTGTDVEKLLGEKKELSANEKAYLEAIAKRWQTFALREGTDEQSRAIAAEGHFRVAMLWQKLGRRDEARPEYERTIAIREKLAAEFPAVPGYLFELAQGHSNLGNLLADLGKGAEAEEQYRKALAIREKLAAEFPAVPDYRSDLAKNHNNLGVLLKDLGKGAEAEEQYRKGLAHQEKLAAEFPAVPDSHFDLARSHNNLGLLLAELGKRVEAEEQYRKGLAIRERLAAAFPDVPVYRHELATSHTNLGSVLVLGKEAEEQVRKALTLNQKLAAEFPSVPDYGRHLALSHTNLGALLMGLGKRAEAEEQYLKGLAIREKLAAEFPAVPGYRHDLALSHNNLGDLLAGLGKQAEAEEQYRKGLTLNQKLAAEFPAVPGYRRALAGSHTSLGNLLAGLGKGAEAEEQYRNGLAVEEKLAAEFPAAPGYRSALAGSHNNLGTLLSDLGKRAEAEEQFRKALAVKEKLAADFPVLDHRSALAMSHNNLGALLASLGKGAEAEEQYRKGLALWEKLAADVPAVPEYRFGLAASHTNLGLLLANLGKRPEAEEQYRKGLAHQEKLAADFPAVPDYQSHLATGHNNLGILLNDLGKLAEAEEQYRKGLEIREKLAADFPAVPDYQTELGGTYCNMGNLVAKVGKPAESLVWLNKAIETLTPVYEADRRAVTAKQFLRNSHESRAMAYDKLGKHAEAAKDWDQAVELSPKEEQPARRANLAISHTNLGLLLAGVGKRPEAEEQFRKGLALKEKLAADFPAVPGYRISLGVSFLNLGDFVRYGGKPADSLEWFDKAIKTLRPFHEAELGDVTAKLALRNSHASRAIACDALGNHAEAVKDWDVTIELSPKEEQPAQRATRASSRLRAGQLAEAVADVAELTKSPNWDANQWYDFVCVYAVASGKVADKKAEYADRAMELLAKAVKAGWKDAAHMKKDTDLDPLREREDFKKLLAELEATSGK